MNSVLIIIVLALVVFIAVVQFILLRKKTQIDFAPIQSTLMIS